MTPDFGPIVNVIARLAQVWNEKPTDELVFDTQKQKNILTKPYTTSDQNCDEAQRHQQLL